jgi:hypothetical protein
VAFTVPGPAVPGFAVPGVMDPAFPAASAPAPPPAAAVVFALGTPFFQWETREPYLS